MSRIGDTLGSRNAIKDLDQRHSRLKKRLYRLPIAGICMLGKPPPSAHAEPCLIEA